MRANTPSVTTSTRVRAETLDSSRMRRPIVSPTRFAKRRRHARGGGARGEAARLQQNDLAAPRPFGVEQSERNARRLAGAGRRHDDEIAAPSPSAAAMRGSTSSIGSLSENAVKDGAARRARSLLLGDDLVLDLVIDALGNDLLLIELVLALVGPALHDRHGARRAYARQSVQLLHRRGIDVEQFRGGSRRSGVGAAGRAGAGVGTAG